MAFCMQQSAPRLRVQDLTASNKIIKEFKNLQPIINFNNLKGNTKQAEIWTYSDASFNISSGRDYGQTGIITGILIKNYNDETAFHVIDWGSKK